MCSFSVSLFSVSLSSTPALLRTLSPSRTHARSLSLSSLVLSCRFFCFFLPPFHTHARTQARIHTARVILAIWEPGTRSFCTSRITSSSISSLQMPNLAHSKMASTSSCLSTDGSMIGKSIHDDKGAQNIHLTRAHTYTHTNMHAHTHTRTRTRTHMHIHTHT